MTFDKHHNFISVAKAALNHFIDEKFTDEEGNPAPVGDTDLVNPVSAFKKALKIDDTDSIHAVNGKMLLAIVGSGYLAEILENEFYGIPKPDYKQSKTGLKEQILFSFREPKSEQKKRRAANPKRMQIGVNVQGVTLNIAAIQQKIKEAFPDVTETSEMHFCGLNKYSYYAPEDGLQITQLPANTELIAKALITKICGIFDINFRNDRLRVSKAALTTEETDPNVGYVYLHKVTLIKGKDNDLILYRPLLSK